MTIEAAGPELANIGPGSPKRGVALPRALDLTERTLVVLTFMFYLGANVASLNPLNIIVALVDTVTVFYILLRRPADSVSLAPFDWAIAIIGTVGAMFARPGGTPLIGDVIPMVAFCSGLFVSGAAKLSLNRRFGVAPANRGVQVKGAYAFIRHPMYAGYLFMNLGYFLLNPTWFNLAIYLVTWACQFIRVRREEQWLRQDPAYCEYASKVRFRFVPGLV
jgi:protein-S-isoprenylcysteine O-methyltransferase Ste14